MLRQVGFTFIELCITLFLLTLIGYFSYSSIAAVYKKNQWQVLVDEAKGAISFAKIHSMLGNQPLVLSRLPGSTEWADGMLLFVDNKEHEYRFGVNIIHEWHWHKSNIHVEWHGFQSKTSLIFSSDLRKSTCNGRFLFTSPSHASTTLWINRLGRVKTS